VCLADWTEIHLASGQYLAEKHNEGRWFRTGHLKPTGVWGSNLKDALRERGVEITEEDEDEDLVAL
jgi:hypothetical protein